MIPQEQTAQIEEIYNEAIRKMEAFGKERKIIVHEYIKELERQKIEAIRASL